MNRSLVLILSALVSTAGIVHAATSAPLGTQAGDLSITKTDNLTTVLSGGTLNYTIVAGNFSQQAATATVTDAFPLQCGSINWSCAGSAGGTCVSGGYGSINTLVNLPAGASVTFNASCGVTGGLAGGTVISNTANVALVGGTDPNLANNSATDTTTVIGETIISGTKSVSGTFEPGGTVTYTIVLSNTGTGAQADNPGAEFVDVLPASLNLVSASASSGTAVATIATRTVTWNGALAAKGTATITIVATVGAGASGTISNSGTINYDRDGSGTNSSGRSTDDPSLPGDGDATDFVVTGVAGPVTAVPSAGFWGLVALTVLTLGFGLHRRLV